MVFSGRAFSTQAIIKLTRWIELFEGDNGRLSMTRLTVFLSFFPASIVLMRASTETIYGLYLGAYVIGYLGGKWADRPQGNPVTINQKGAGDVNMVKTTTE